VTRIYTDIAVVEITPNGFVAREILDGVSADDLRQKTGAPIDLALDCATLSAPEL
jgi:3-oxoadipate CoA-transferase beta subunit